MAGTPSARGVRRSDASSTRSQLLRQQTQPSQSQPQHRGSVDAASSASAHARAHGGALATIKSYYRGTSSFSLTDETDRWSSSDRSPTHEQPFVALDAGSPRPKKERRRTRRSSLGLGFGEHDESKSDADYEEGPSSESEEDEEEQVDPRRANHLQLKHRSSPRVLTSVTLLALCYFVVGGGPESAEQIVVAAGPLMGLVSLVAFPLLYFYPMAFTVTELVSAIPEAGGHAYWIATVFGPRMGLQAGYWSWVSNCVDCAIYSSMSIAAIYRVAGLVGLPFLEFVLKATLSLLLALPGFFDLRVVGSLAASLAVFVLVPYALMATWSAVKVENWSSLEDLRHANTTSSSTGSSLSTSSTNASGSGSSDALGAVEVAVADLITYLVWNFNGFQNLSVFAKCVQDPARTYRRVMFFAFLVTPLSFLVPITPVIALAQPSWTEWTGSACMFDAAKYLGGFPYEIWVTVVAMLSTTGLFIGGLLCSAYLACGMAKNGFAPRALGMMGLGRYKSHDIDHGVIFGSLAVVLIVINLETKDMVLISNALEGLETMLLIFAAVRLRFTRPDLRRPTKLCGDAPPIFMILLLIFPLACSGFVVGWAFTSVIPAAITSVFLFSGLMYGIQAEFQSFRARYQLVRQGPPEPAVA